MTPTIPAGFTWPILQRPTAANQLENENDERDQQQNVNVSAQNVEPNETEQPHNQQNDKDSPKHKKTFELRLLLMVRFATHDRA
jgi:hypothetical protein